jgi:hypothetical protein
MSAKRDEAARILAEVPKGNGIQSNLEPKRFADLTGQTHDKMMENWRANGIQTACIDFAVTYAKRIGIIGSPKTGGVVIASLFEMEKSLIDAGKGYAWVNASSKGAKPDVGDILRHKAYHVDVAAGWKDNKLIRVAAGQSNHPRPTTSVENEYDALKWVAGTSDYDSTALLGWLDLDKFFDAAPVDDSALGWLHGWWKVWDGSTYYYYFSRGGGVEYIKKEPPKGGGPPKLANNLGSYTYKLPNELVVTWDRVAGAEEACKETFYNASPGCKQMNATSTLYSPLVATRLD